MDGCRLVAVGLLALVAGCRFSREIINPQVRELETAWIQPGVTTRQQVIDRLGFPPTVRELGGVSPNAFHWTLLDTFTGTFEAGYVITPTFERGREHFAEDILVTFDDAGIVNRVSRTRSDGEQVEVLEWKERP